MEVPLCTGPDEVLLGGLLVVLTGGVVEGGAVVGADVGAVVGAVVGGAVPGRHW
jgi:hypothetical protein